MHTELSTPMPSPEQSHHPDIPTDQRVDDSVVALHPPSVSATSPSSDLLRRELAERPWVTLGAAAAVGFIIGGGATSPALWGLARLGARFALAVAGREFDTVLAAPATTSSWSA